MWAFHTEFWSSRKAVVHKYVQQTLPGRVLGREAHFKHLSLASCAWTLHDLDVTSISATFLPLALYWQEGQCSKNWDSWVPHDNLAPQRWATGSLLPPRGSFAFSAKVKLAGVFQGLQETMHVSISEAYPQGTDVNKPLCWVFIYHLLWAKVSWGIKDEDDIALLSRSSQSSRKDRHALNW